MADLSKTAALERLRELALALLSSEEEPATAFDSLARAALEGLSDVDPELLERLPLAADRAQMERWLIDLLGQDPAPQELGVLGFRLAPSEWHGRIDACDLVIEAADALDTSAGWRAKEPFPSAVCARLLRAAGRTAGCTREVLEVLAVSYVAFAVADVLRRIDPRLVLEGRPEREVVVGFEGGPEIEVAQLTSSGPEPGAARWLPGERPADRA